MKLSQNQIEDFQNDGVVLIKGLYKDWVDQISAGIERNMAAPGPDHHQYIDDGESGGFFGDYCNWQRIPEFVDAINNSDAASVAAQLMKSNKVMYLYLFLKWIVVVFLLCLALTQMYVRTCTANY